jgi:DNA-directed RNA polymerase specialized sigma24 family protein
MLNIFSRLSQLNDVESFKQWAMRVVENEAKMYRRKRRQHLYESIDTSTPEPAQEKPFRPRQFADCRELPSDIRAYAMQGDTAKAKAAYNDFLTLWKDADPDIPILKQAKAEYAKLQ